jgi:WD40 repeat protein
LGFFPDGKRLASASVDKTARIWGVALGRQTCSPLKHDSPVLALAVSDDGGDIVAGLTFGRLIDWPLKDGQPQKPRAIPWYAGYKSWVAAQPPSLSFSYDGKILGMAGPGGIFRAEDRSGRFLYALSGSGIAPVSAAYSPNSAILATVSRSNELTFWNTQTWTARRAFGSPLSVVRSLAFSGDGRTVAVGSDSPLESQSISGFPSSPNVRISAGDDSKKQAEGTQKPHWRDYRTWRATTDSLRFWDVGSSDEQRLLESSPTPAMLPNIAWSSGGKMLAGAGGDGSVWAWDVERHTLLTHFFLDSRVGSKLQAASGANGLLAQEDLLDSNRAPLLAFSPDGADLVSCDHDGVVKSWDTVSWREKVSFPDHESDVAFVALSPDGDMLAVNCRGQIRFYDPRTGKRMFSVGKENDPSVLCGKFSPNGRALAVGTLDGKVKCVDLASRSVTATLVGHVDAVSSLAFSPDGRTLATGSWDSTIRLWNVASLREVGVLEGHRGRVHAVAFSPDGRVLASGGEIDDSREQGLGELFFWRAPRIEDSTTASP